MGSAAVAEPLPSGSRPSVTSEGRPLGIADHGPEVDLRVAARRARGSCRRTGCPGSGTGAAGGLRMEPGHGVRHRASDPRGVPRRRPRRGGALSTASSPALAVAHRDGCHRLGAGGIDGVHGGQQRARGGGPHLEDGRCADELRAPARRGCWTPPPSRRPRRRPAPRRATAGPGCAGRRAAGRCSATRGMRPRSTSDGSARRSHAPGTAWPGLRGGRRRGR